MGSEMCIRDRPSELCSSHSIRIPDKQDLVVRMSCWAASDWFTEEEKERAETRSIRFRGVVTYRRYTEEMRFFLGSRGGSFYCGGTGVGYARGHGLCVAIVNGQVAKTLGRISTRETDHLPLVTYCSDVGVLSVVL